MTHGCRRYTLATAWAPLLLVATLEPAGHAWPGGQAQTVRVVLAEMFTATW
jgi:hypothetical protein